MSKEPQYILNNFSNWDIIDHSVPPHYVHAALGLSSSYLLSVNFLFFLIYIIIKSVVCVQNEKGK